MLLDYRVRIYVTSCLLERANGPCKQCAKSAAGEVAFCYTLGFGVQYNSDEAQKWMARSGTSNSQLDQRICYLRNLTTTGIESTTHARSGNSGMFSIDLTARYRRLTFDEVAAHLTQEVDDLERQLGPNNWQIFDLEAELIHILSSQSKHEEATQMLEALRRSFPVSHVLHIRATLPLVAFYVRQGCLNDAENILLQAKHTTVEKFGREHPLSIRICDTLARVYEERGKDQEALGEYMQLSEVVSKTLHPNHQLAPATNLRYLTLLKRQGKSRDADEILGSHVQQTR